MSAPALESADLDRFGKIIGLLASDHDGERAAAARKATEFLNLRSMGWPDVVVMLRRPPAIITAPYASPRPATDPEHQRDAVRCLMSAIAWQQHERQFLVQMSNQRRRPSEKQLDWLHGLLDRVVRYEARRAA